MGDDAMSWTKAAEVDRLDREPVVFKHSPRQVAIFKVADKIFAIDNRCPHEGYPLAAGTITPDCVLTCNWHNWKFRLADGECLVGGDHVRSYKTRVENGEVWIDLTPPPPDEIRREVLRGLRTAFDERDFGRICREIARLDYEGLDPLDAVRSAVEWSHDRLEFGTTHAMAATADWLKLSLLWPGDRERQVVCLAEAVDHLAFDSLRHPQYPYPDSGEPFSSEAFESAIETEQVAHAAGMVRRGLADGLHWVDMEESFVAAALEHYNSFGHALIYVRKVGQLIEFLGDEIEPFLLLPMARKLGYATREDLIPEFREYAPALGRLPDPDGGLVDSERPEVPFPMTLTKALAWLEESLAAYPVDQVYDALLEALSLSLLHFDTEYQAATDGPVTENVGWLDFTHGLTFANASRLMCLKYPRFWRPALAQMACFLGRNHSFIDRAPDTESWHVSDAGRFFDGVHEVLLDHGLRDPIFSAHHLKTSIAVEEEIGVASPSSKQAMLDSLNRFLNSPIKMKHVRRLARQAIALVGRDYEN